MSAYVVISLALSAASCASPCSDDRSTAEQRGAPSSISEDSVDGVSPATETGGGPPAVRVPVLGSVEIDGDALPEVREAMLQLEDEVAGGEDKERDDPLYPPSFVGFSSDETRFAYSAYSEGAGVYLFTVIDSATGRRVTDLPLYDDETEALARRILDEGGYSPGSADGAEALAGDETLRLEAEPWEVRVLLEKDGGEVRLETPAALADVARRLRRPRVDLWGFSPSGRYVGVRITEDQGPMLGEATTYQVFCLERGRARLTE